MKDIAARFHVDSSDPAGKDKSTMHREKRMNRWRDDLEQGMHYSLKVQRQALDRNKDLYHNDKRIGIGFQRGQMTEHGEVFFDWLFSPWKKNQGHRLPQLCYVCSKHGSKGCTLISLFNALNNNVKWVLLLFSVSRWENQDRGIKRLAWSPTASPWWPTRKREVAAWEKT